MWLLSLNRALTTFLSQYTFRTQPEGNSDRDFTGRGITGIRHGVPDFFCGDVLIPSDKKYQNDPQFRQLVDTVLMLIHQQKTSFAEIREALLFAQLKYEMENPSKLVFSPELQRELEFRLNRDFRVDLDLSKP